MTRHRLVVAMAAALALGAAVFAQDLEVELEKAIQSHAATRNHGKAIDDFRRIADEAERASNDAVAARALLQLADGYVAVRDTEAAAKVFQRIVTRYGEQTNAVAIAREQLRIVAPSAGQARSPEPPSAAATASPIRSIGEDVSGFPYVTPDGRLLSRADWNGGDIVIRDLRTDGVQRLQGMGARYAMVSHDGSRVLCFCRGPSAELHDLWIIATDGDANSRQLAMRPAYTYVLPIGWAPDGQRALVVASRRNRSTWEDEAQLIWVDVATGEREILKYLGQRSVDRFSLSPDGRFVAYSLLAAPRERDADGRWTPTTTNEHIYVLPTDGSGTETPVVTGRNINAAPVWTPDGKRLVFVSNRDADGRFGLWSVAVSDGRAAGTERYVEHGPTGWIYPIGITADGTFYYVPERAFAGGDGLDIFTASLNTPAGRPISHPVRLLDSKLDSNVSPRLSPDAQRVAYVRARPESENSSDRYEVVVHSLDTAQETSLFISGLTQAPPVWLHDGSLLLHAPADGRLLVWNPEQDEHHRTGDAIAPAKLPEGWSWAAPSHDGKNLYLFVSRRGAAGPEQRIVVFDPNTGETSTIWTLPGPLVPPGRLDIRPARLAVSPDGTSLVATLQLEGWSRPRLLHVPVDRSGHRELLDGVVEGTAAWAPDSRSVLVANGEGELVWVSVVDRSVTATGLTMAGNSLDLSRDGSRVVYTDRTRNTDSVWAHDDFLALLK